MEENKTTLAYWRAAVKAVNKGKLPVPFPKKGSPLHKKAKAEFRKYMNGTRKPKKSKNKNLLITFFDYENQGHSFSPTPHKMGKRRTNTRRRRLYEAKMRGKERLEMEEARLADPETLVGHARLPIADLERFYKERKQRREEEDGKYIGLPAFGLYASYVVGPSSAFFVDCLTAMFSVPLLTAMFFGRRPSTFISRLTATYSSVWNCFSK